MPQSVTELKVFIAGPTDMLADKDIIREAIEESNNLSAVGAVRLRAVSWERQATPQSAPTAQAAINEQLLRDYDIMIAVIGHRLGTPDAGGTTGTMQEIENALQKTNSRLAGHHIQIYFKRVKLDIANIDVEEVQLLKDFRARITKQVLFRDYDTEGELKSLVLQALQRAKGVLETQPVEAAKSEELEDGKKLVATESDDEEPGILDLVAGFESEMALVSEGLDGITEITKSLTSRTEQLAAQAFDPSGPTSAKKRAVDEYGEVMMKSAEGLREHDAKMKQHFESATDQFETFLLSADFEHENPNDIASLRQVLLNAIQSVSAFGESVQSASKSIEPFPRLTRQFNVGKRNLVEAMSMVRETSLLITSKLNDYANYIG